MKNDLSAEHEYAMIVVDIKEINLIYQYLERFILKTYREILINADDDKNAVQTIIYDLSVPVQFRWYMNQYLKDYERKIEKGEKSDGYLLDIGYNDLELLGKVIAMYDKEEKLKGFLAKSDKLLYFYQNFKAAQGK